MTEITLDDIIQIAKNANKFDPDKKILEQGIDSLDFTKLLFEVEDTFQITIPDEDFDEKKWDTLNKIVEKVNLLR